MYQVCRKNKKVIRKYYISFYRYLLTRTISDPLTWFIVHLIVWKTKNFINLYKVIEKHKSKS